MCCYLEQELGIDLRQKTWALAGKKLLENKLSLKSEYPFGGIRSSMSPVLQTLSLSPSVKLELNALLLFLE